MKKSLCISLLFCLFAQTASSQSTWLPEGDYLLFSDFPGILMQLTNGSHSGSARLNVVRGN